MLKSYANYFTAYLLDNAKETSNIIRIVLFGSVAKGEQGKESDLDIFIEVKKKTKRFEDEIKTIEEKFYSSRESLLFKSKGVNNKFSIKIGKLEEWQDLYRSIASTGIVLYGPYEARELPSGVKNYIIFYWDKIGKNRGSFLNKVYGFKVQGRAYSGLLQKYQGQKLGKSCILLLVQYKADIFNLIKEHKVQAKFLEVYF